MMAALAGTMEEAVVYKAEKNLYCVWHLLNKYQTLVLINY